MLLLRAKKGFRRTRKSQLLEGIEFDLKRLLLL
jgi:hypothetical protein